MKPMTDAELLHRYVSVRAEDAFAEFVRRHLGLVYFAALRRLGGDTALAEDISQAVFTLAAREARKLARHPAVTGWLYTTTRNLAAKAMRAEQARQRLEHEAALTRALTMDTAPADWERLRPVIDDALDELNARDRESVLLRFFESQPFAAIGRTTQISEDAARMRVERALSRLRVALQRRGVTSTEAALGLLLAQQASAVAPLGLASAITNAAVAATAAAGVSASTALFSVLSTTKVSTAITLAAVIAFSFAVHERSDATRVDAEFAAALRDLSDTTARLRWTEQQASIVAPSAQPLRSADVTSRPSVGAREPEARAKGTALMERHAEVKTAFREWTSGRISADYTPLFQTLGLAPEQIDRFKELHRDQHALGFEASPESPDMAALELHLPPVAPTRTSGAEIQSLLGPQGFDAYQEFQRTRPARELAMRIVETLALDNEPLTVEQAGELVRIINASGLDTPDSLPGPFDLRVDWNNVVARSRARFSPAQIAAIELLQVEDRYENAWREAVAPRKPDASNP